MGPPVGPPQIALEALLTRAVSSASPEWQKHRRAHVWGKEEELELAHSLMLGRAPRGVNRRKHDFDWP